ncbi:hypothetical protein GGD81_000527 [Rhodobium orientis]|nr:hypothetical protein [Rhodobium orientis]MBB4301510.1 hypothetical protein [Rhodobium orientis]
MSRSTDLPVGPVVDMAPETARQIEELDLKDGPLILCDVDEVALHFIAPFERHLLAHGFELVARSYGLNGNIVRQEDREPASREEVRELLLGFFDAETGNQQPVAGVAEALGELSQAAEVVMLTNIPERHRQLRSETLARHGMPYPVITNTGPKGPAARLLAERADGAVVFLDDSPSNIRSVGAFVDGASLVQFIADRRFFDLAGPIDGLSLKANDWPAARNFIVGRFGF